MEYRDVELLSQNEINILLQDKLFILFTYKLV